MYSTVNAGGPSPVHRGMRHLLLLAVLLFSSCGETPDPWRADARQLLERTERLAQAGDLEAARGTLVELEKRGDAALLDRGRAALARALLAADHRDEAQVLLGQVAWADKAPAVAGELVGLDLAIRWRGLFRAGQLISGMIPAVESQDSDQGLPGGAWSAREEAWIAWKALLNGGVRMVEREGGRVVMPAVPGWVALARWTYGEASWAETASVLGGDPAVLLAAVHLHLSEHDPERALDAAELLWRAPGTIADEAYAALRRWQLRRRSLGGDRLPLWPFPAVDARLDEVASEHAAGDAAAHADVAAEREVGGAALQRALVQQAQLSVVEPEESSVVEADGTVRREKTGAEWRLAFSHDGLSLGLAESTVPVGQPVICTVGGDYRGSHRLELFRIEDADAWERLRRRPRREDLPAVAMAVRELAAGEGSASFPGLSEGNWIVALSARACPVVVLRSVRVAATALHVQAGVDGVLAWTVGRADGRGVPCPLRVDWQLQRDARTAAGAAWNDATPAWRAGFSEGFLGRPDPAWMSDGSAADLAAGRAAGATAAASDPPFVLSATVTTGPDGVLRLELPRELLGRAWTVRVAVERPSAHEEVTAAWGEASSWTARVVCWADKPLVRPGETLRFAGILREHDGERFRLPAGGSVGEVRVGGEPVWRGQLQPDVRGMIGGSVAIPAGAVEGAVELRLGGAVHRLAVCDRVALPPVLLSVAADGASLLAGETRILRLHLSDAAGAPLAATPIVIDMHVTSRDRGEPIPVEVPKSVTTDLAGDAHVLVPTAEGREATWIARLSVVRDGRTWEIHHTWSTTIFPFQVEAEPEATTVEAGGVLRVRLRLPADARVRLQAMRGDQPLAKPWPVTGGSDGTAEVLLAIEERHVGADALRLSADVPGGGEVSRRIALRITAHPPADGSEAVACLPERTRLAPGDELGVTVGTSSPGRDVLLLAGSGAVIHHDLIRVEAAVNRVACSITPAWGPETHLQAVAWLPGRGFTASRRTTLSILPIDRLLRVTLRPDRAEPRPGDAVRVRISVRDWKDQPVAGAGLTLGAVDQRLYALAEDATPDLWRFFHDHRRPWRLVAGDSVDQGTVSGLLWRSVVWRWQGGEDGDPGMVGHGGAYSAHGGRGRKVLAASAIRSLGTEADPAIAWLSGVVSDAQGEAEVVVELPRSAGAWRLTARAADGSAAVMVGEVRTVLTATRRLDVHLSGPRLARTGDRLVLQAEVANHGDVNATITLRSGTNEQQVALDARVRRTIAVPVTVPEPAVDAVVRRLGDHLGRIVRLPVTIAPGTADEVTTELEVLTLPDGLPEHRELQLVAGSDGRLVLPVGIPASSLVHAELRAWPDLGARRDAELLRWRSREDAQGAMAWLLASPGAQRRAELARRWPELDQSSAAQVVRLVAQRLGCGGGGLRDLADDAVGDWLRARARLAGLPLSAPLRHRDPREALDGRIAIAGTALAEGWGEGARQWRALAAEVGASDSALALALGVDAARLAGDFATQQVLMARLATVAWDDPLAAVLAAELLPAAGPAVTVPLRIAGHAVEAAAGATWSGVLGEPLLLSAPAGAVVALSLRWQAPVQPEDGKDSHIGAITLRVREGDGYRALRPGEAAPPDQPMLVSATVQAGWRARFVLPGGLRSVAPPTTPARLLDVDTAWHWQIRDDDRSTVGNLAYEWQESASRRAAALDAWNAALARVEQRPIRTLREVEIVAADAEAGPVLLTQGQAIAVMASGEGEMRWAEVRFERISDHAYGGRQILPRLRVATEDRPAETLPLTGHPQRAALLAAAVDGESLVWLVGQERLWDGVIAILDPRIEHGLSDLQQHPACGRPGHWTSVQLRRWLDAEPGLDGFSADVVARLEAAAQVLSLEWLVEQASASRDDRRQARAALQGPQLPPRRAQAPIRGWFAAASKGSALPGTTWETWLWNQEVSQETLHSLGYDGTLDGWATFLRLECDLPIRLGSGCTGGEPAPSGQLLGTAALAARDLVLTRQPDGTLLLATSMPDHRASPAPLDIDWEDRDFAEALEAFNRLLANRGVRPLSVPPEFLEQNPIPLTLRVKAMHWRDAAVFIGKISGLELVGHEFRRPAQP